ncbi:MAG: sialate O-acetylesterase [Ruminococcaceae bacterium]|nr:sialate O-acetylesterase [Oscillospiraceae bacterium]
MIHSFLLIGQSNMAGRGYLNDAPEIDTSHIKILRNGRWQEMFRPINPDRSFSGTSLAESFAECYAKKYNVDVGLICCADGGTSLDQWKPGEVLFDNAVFQAKLAMRSSALVGVLWHQGEADCREELYTTYEKRFVVLMDALRRELDIADVPFLLGGLGDFLKDCALDDNLKNYTYVNEALKSITQNNEMTGFVSAQGLLPNPDNLHFNAQALYEFGLRYFDEYEKFVKKDRCISETGDKDSARTAMEML